MIDQTPVSNFYPMRLFYNTSKKSIVAFLVLYVILFSFKIKTQYFDLVGSSKETSTTTLKNLTEDHMLDYENCTTNDTLPENWCMDMNKVPRYVGKCISVGSS